MFHFWGVLTWRFMGSYKQGYKYLSLGHDVSYLTYTYDYT